MAKGFHFFVTQCQSTRRSYRASYVGVSLLFVWGKSPHFVLKEHPEAEKTCHFAGPLMFRQTTWSCRVSMSRNTKCPHEAANVECTQRGGILSATACKSYQPMFEGSRYSFLPAKGCLYCKEVCTWANSNRCLSPKEGAPITSAYPLFSTSIQTTTRLLALIQFQPRVQNK